MDGFIHVGALVDVHLRLGLLNIHYLHTSFGYLLFRKPVV